MKKSIYITILVLLVNGLNVQAQISKLKKGLEKSGISIPTKQGLSEEEVGRGLKEALNNGIQKGVKQLSIKDGYFKDDQIKLLMPKEATQVESKLRKL